MREHWLCLAPFATNAKDLCITEDTPFSRPPLSGKLIAKHTVHTRMANLSDCVTDKSLGCPLPHLPHKLVMHYKILVCSMVRAASADIASAYPVAHGNIMCWCMMRSEPGEFLGWRPVSGECRLANMSGSCCLPVVSVGCES